MTKSTTKSIDLNSDMGEGFGAYKMGDDDAILEIVSSANVACGFHAGDPEIMARTFLEAKKRGVVVGAHPGYPDLWGFGRRVIPYSSAEIERLIAYQVGAAMALSTYAGHPITYVKPHGALGNLTQTEPDVARAIGQAVKAVNPNLALLTFANGHLERWARDAGVRACAEIFADRAYTDEGHLVHRKQPGAVLHDPQAAADRALRMVSEGAIETITGKLIKAPIESICVHSDTPGAIEMASRLRSVLQGAGIQIQPFA